MYLHHTFCDEKLEDFYEPTLNQNGFMLKKLDPFALKFLDYIEKEQSGGLPSIEIGAAFGIVTLEAHRRGLHVVANDLCEDHLRSLQERAQKLCLPVIPVLSGDFFNLSIPSNSVNSIYISRVLHFFDGDDIIKALNLFYDWIIPGGKLFAINETPYFGTASQYLPQYLAKKEAQDPWPGIIEKLHIENDGDQTYLNQKAHLLDEETCHKCIEQTPFIVEDLRYYSRRGYFPPTALMDDRESIGFILRKADT